MPGWLSQNDAYSGWSTGETKVEVRCWWPRKKRKKKHLVEVTAQRCKGFCPGGKDLGPGRLRGARHRWSDLVVLKSFSKIRTDYAVLSKPSSVFLVQRTFTFRVAAILHVKHSTKRRRCSGDIDLDTHRLLVASAATTPAMLRPKSIGIATILTGNGEERCYIHMEGSDRKISNCHFLSSISISFFNVKWRQFQKKKKSRHSFLLFKHENAAIVHKRNNLSKKNLTASTSFPSETTPYIELILQRLRT